MTQDPPNAKELPAEAIWLNVEGSLRLEELQGSVVLLYFWNATNVHCHNLLATLASLERLFADRAFAVLGVHTAKYPGEADVGAVRDAVRRYRIRHPVLVDEDGACFRSYGCSAWPYLVLIDDCGRVRFHAPGEPDRERLAQALAGLLNQAEEEGFPELSGIHYRPEPGAELPLQGLCYPERIVIDDERGLLWVADTGNHRILGIDRTAGTVQHVLGHGVPGSADGVGRDVGFCEPRGLAVDGDLLWIVDSGNHLLRAAALPGLAVETYLGTGRAERDLDGGSMGIAQSLSSPSDVAVDEHEVLFSMTGQHQVWRMEKSSRTAFPMAGDGRPGLMDGEGFLARLAQPTGLAIDPSGHALLFADADSCALRVLDLRTGGVQTLVGEGVGVFGDSDGSLAVARLQLPTGVALRAGLLFFTDTLNGKVRVLDAASGDVRTKFEGLDRPEGLAIHGDRLWLCETGRHRVLTADLSADEPRLEPFAIDGLPTNLAATAPRRSDPVTFARFADATLRVPLTVPRGERVHPEIPVAVEVTSVEGNALAVDVSLVAEIDGAEAIVAGVPIHEEDGVLGLRMTWVTCVEPDEVHHVHEQNLEVPVRLEEEGDEVATVTLAQGA